MSPMNRYILQSLLCVAYATAFFQMFKSAPAEHHTVDDNLVRGVPEHQHKNYLSDVFTCDGGKVILSKSDVNNDYCDCLDRSDEPGTSACVSNTFHCINKGYKMVMIPSSRVDDSLCDCCDGSDESYGKCPNTCNAAAERERAALAGATAAYKVGSIARNNLIQSIKVEKNALAERLGPLTMDVARLGNEIAVAQAALDTRKAAVEAAKQTALADIITDLNNLIDVRSVNVEQFSHLLSGMLNVLGLEQHQLDALLPPAAAADLPAHSDDDVTAENGAPEEDSFYEGYGAEGVKAPAVAGPTCPMVEHAADHRLAPLCTAEDVLTEAAKLLHSLIQEHSAHSAR